MVCTAMIDDGCILDVKITAKVDEYFFTMGIKRCEKSFALRPGGLFS
jgi:hypothetical protein